MFINIDSGEIVGEHSGLHKWTVGQRCCLPNYKHPYFIFEKDLTTNNIYVVSLYEYSIQFGSVGNTIDYIFLFSDTVSLIRQWFLAFF